MREAKYLKIIVALILVVSTIVVVALLIGKNGQQEKTDNELTNEASTENTSDNTTDNSTSSTLVESNNDDEETGEDTKLSEEDTDKDNEPDGEEKRNVKPVKARAVYLSGNSAGRPEVIDNIIELSKTTELNAVVIDVKEAGVVNYISGVTEVVKDELFVDYYDPVDLIKKLHDNDIYVIGRIVCFMDKGLGVKRPDLAIKKTNGEPWVEGKLGTWVNPYNDEVRSYNIDIAKEAAEKGFDEIQFDYVRFPSGTGTLVDYGSDAPTKSEAICSFLEAASKELVDEMGVLISADVFGIICLDPNTKNSIGQDLESIGRYVDYICPMVYPSHYANASTTHYTGNGIGQKINGVLFTAPDLDPYNVIYNTLLVSKERISKVDNYRAGVRPYLQSFTASYLPQAYYQEYGVEQIKQQIKAVYDAGYEEWILWNSANVYPSEIFENK